MVVEAAMCAGRRKDAVVTATADGNGRDVGKVYFVCGGAGAHGQGRITNGGEIAIIRWATIDGRGGVAVD